MKKRPAGFWMRLVARLRQPPQEIKAVSLIVMVLFLVLFSIGFGFQQRHRNDPLKLGVSFSIKYARELGNDWKTNYLALIEDIGVRHLRLMSYWDLLEPDNNSFTFEDLDWQFKKAEDAGAKITLAVGQRQPRWPECHTPAWSTQLEPSAYGRELLDYIEQVVNRYKNSPALESYQVENEAANRLFGSCPPLDINLFKREIALINELDPSHTIITNTSNQSGIPLRQPVGDKVGFSIYRRAHFEALGRQNYWSFWYVPAWWHSFRAGIVEGLHKAEPFVHELQAEPWGPAATVDLTSVEQDKTMDPDKLKEIVNFALDTGMSEVYLWGGEWWYYRLYRFNDQQLWDTVKQLYS